MSRLKNMAVCRENQEIIEQNYYEREEDKIPFDHTLEELKKVEVLSPDRVAELMEKVLPETSDKDCRIIVANVDSYYAKTDLVMNFANSFHPGGGYIRGASAQEEALCRQSTLYASISSKEANEMYEYNLMHLNPFDSDYMLLSPAVEVFRDADLEFLQQPFTTAVMTAAAPNLNQTAKGQPLDKVDEIMKDKIRKYLVCAACFGYKRITLGAWGCGAFGHDAKRVAGYFYDLLIRENMKAYFDFILFAVLDKADYPYNYISFAECFADCAYCVNFEEKNAERPYYAARLPWPVCSHSGNEAPKESFCQGILSDGIPFEASLIKTQKDSLLTVVMPFREADSINHLEKAADRSRILPMEANAKESSGLLSGMKELGREENVFHVKRYGDYLADCGLVSFLADDWQTELSYYEDLAGRKVAVVLIRMEREEKKMADTPLFK